MRILAVKHKFLSFFRTLRRINYEQDRFSEHIGKTTL